MTDLEVSSQTMIAAKAKQKSAYQCPGCKNKVCGKARINIVCGSCDIRFTEIQG